MVKNILNKNILNLTREQKKILLITLFAVAGVLSDLLATKICTWGNFTIEAGCILFVAVYLAADVITETYGFETMIKTALLGMAMKVFMVIVGTIAILLPYDPVSFAVAQQSLEYVFGFVPRIVIASLIGYICGQWVNAKSMVIIKKMTNSKYLFIRTIGSTILGEFIDTLLFITIAFIGTMPLGNLGSFILTQYIMKVLIETFLQPITYRAVSWAKNNNVEEDLSLS